MTAPQGGIDYLTLDDLLEIASEVVETLTVRDLGLLASAAARPQGTAFGTDAYPSFADKAAALMHSLARNHALVDGNKRLAWAATRIFCLLNERELSLSVDEAEALVVAAATGAVDVSALSAKLEHAIGSAGAQPG